jgi:hypothetical protein
MASTPVRALQPEAKAFSRSRTPTLVALPVTTDSLLTRFTGTSRKRPTTMRTKIEPMNTTVGTMNTRADSAIPRRFTAVSSVNTARQSHTRSP